MRTRRDLVPVLALLLGVAFVACDVGQVTFTEARGGLATDALAARVRVGPKDSVQAEALGWEEGVPGATVRVFREDVRQSKLERVEGADSVVTDSSGRVTVDYDRSGGHLAVGTGWARPVPNKPSQIQPQQN